MDALFQFNGIYKDVFSTDKRYIDVLGGRGRGGSHFGTDYFLYLITCPEYFRGYFVRQVLSDIRDSLFRDFKDRIEENDKLRIKDFHIQENSYFYILGEETTFNTDHFLLSLSRMVAGVASAGEA